MKDTKPRGGRASGAPSQPPRLIAGNLSIIFFLLFLSLSLSLSLFLKFIRSLSFSHVFSRMAFHSACELPLCMFRLFLFSPPPPPSSALLPFHLPFHLLAFVFCYFPHFFSAVVFRPDRINRTISRWGRRKHRKNATHTPGVSVCVCVCRGMMNETPHTHTHTQFHPMQIGRG